MDKTTLKRELERRGHGAQTALAEHLGIAPSIVSRMLNSSRKISADEADRIRAWLGQPDQAARALSPAAATAAPWAPAQAMARLPRSSRADLPVWAAAQGGEEGAMLITASPIEWIVRPRELIEVVDAFAIFLMGESMY